MMKLYREKQKRLFKELVHSAPDFTLLSYYNACQRILSNALCTDELLIYEFFTDLLSVIYEEAVSRLCSEDK